MNPLSRLLTFINGGPGGGELYDQLGHGGKYPVEIGNSDCPDWHQIETDSLAAIQRLQGLSSQQPSSTETPSS